jgi:hypothetical protein
VLRRSLSPPVSGLVKGWTVTFSILVLAGDMHDELLNGEIFYTLVEAKILIEAWRRYSNTVNITIIIDHVTIIIMP